ncbi:MAG: replication-associated recombination protein A [Ruminococcaceae bacterium]|nr:replication-associated recombination protein A [Oscillospiraceae bacterium]
MTPLAERIRPTDFDEVVGQEHILGENGALRKIASSPVLPNMIFYGPSGTGKTTVANIIAKNASMTLKKLNATIAQTKDIKEVLAETGTLFGNEGLLLFIDEIQYLNKRQQQTLLEFIEDGRITLIASTTENPYFYVYKAILSRSTVFEFKPLSSSDVSRAVNRGLKILNEENNLSKTIDDEAVKVLSVASGGDVRAAVNALELAYHISDKKIDEESAKSVLKRNYMSFDRDGDNHYELLSALQKSIRGSDENAAVFYLAKLLEGGDIISPCRRLLVIASEDVGLAYPMAASIVKGLVDSALHLGLPEARLPLAEAAILLATAPKSNSAYKAIAAAMEDVRLGYGQDMPSRLKNNHCFGEGDKKDEYLYPHNYKNAWVPQQYLPDDLKDRKYYEFGDNKTERVALEYRNNIRSKAKK